METSLKSIDKNPIKSGGKEVYSILKLIVYWFGIVQQGITDF